MRSTLLSGIILSPSKTSEQIKVCPLDFVISIAFSPKLDFHITKNTLLILSKHIIIFYKFTEKRDNLIIKSPSLKTNITT